MKTQSIATIDAQGHGSDGKPIELPQPADTVLHTAFATDSGQTSPLTELGEDGYFLVHVDKVMPAAVQPLSAVHDKAVSLWQADQKKEELKKLEEQADSRQPAVDSKKTQMLEIDAAFAPATRTRPPLPKAPRADTAPVEGKEGPRSSKAGGFEGAAREMAPVSNTQAMEAITSTAPAAPKQWPTMDFVELMGRAAAQAPNILAMALHSALSFASVPVPWALM